MTKQEIGRLKNNLKDLPKTAKALKDSAETKIQYQLRHLPELIRQLKKYYNYKEVTLEVVQSYRRSYRGVCEETKKMLTERLRELQK